MIPSQVPTKLDSGDPQPEFQSLKTSPQLSLISITLEEFCQKKMPLQQIVDMVYFPNKRQYSPAWICLSDYHKSRHHNSSSPVDFSTIPNSSPVEQLTTKTPELFSPSGNQHTPQIFLLKQNQCSPTEFSSNKEIGSPSRNILKQGLERSYSSSTVEFRDLASKNSTTFVKDLFSKTKITFQQHFMHDKCIQHNLIYFENIIISCISYIMTLHAANFLPF